MQATPGHRELVILGLFEFWSATMRRHRLSR
jgi:hypothetical protein